MELKNKNALVTGAGKGIGRAIVLKLLEEGVNTVGVSRTAVDLDSLFMASKKYPGKFISYTADIGNEDEVDNLFEGGLSEISSIDILINNAGIGIFKPVYELSTEEWDKTFKTNMRGTFLCTSKVLPDMIIKKNGTIVNIASIAGKRGFANGAAYAASKFAMRGFSESLMFDVRKYNIRVITICPGSVATDFHDGAAKKRDKGKVLTSENCAESVIFALKMPENASVSEIELRITNP